MSHTEKLPTIYLARHGETAWSLSGQHTGLTDLPLTETGERNARRLGERLRGMKFVAVWSSPLQRALRTCQLAGPSGRTEWLTGCGPCRETCCFFPADISFECWPVAGLGWKRHAQALSC